MNVSSVTICQAEWLTARGDLNEFAARCDQLAAPYLDFADKDAIASRVANAIRASKDGEFAASFDARGCLNGLGCIASLPWDSEIYGMKMGVVSQLLTAGNLVDQASVIDALLAGLLAHSRENGFRHLTARVSSSHYPAIQGLEAHGFRTMGVQVTLARKGRTPNSEIAHPNGVTTCPFSAADLRFLQDLSADAYVESRLFADPDLPEDATRRLHRLWIENDCTGRAARVLVAHVSGEPVGYIACLLHQAGKANSECNLGDIDLLAVAPKARSKGVASALVEAAIEWFEPRTNQVIVQTQVTNGRAIALYQRKGFRLEEAHTVLHRKFK